MIADGWALRRSDQEETIAWMLATLVNNITTTRKQGLTLEEILGRPLRANYDAALAKKDAQRRKAHEG